MLPIPWRWQLMKELELIFVIVGAWWPEIRLFWRLVLVTKCLPGVTAAAGPEAETGRNGMKRHQTP